MHFKQRIVGLGSILLYEFRLREIRDGWKRSRYFNYICSYDLNFYDQVRITEDEQLCLGDDWLIVRMFYLTGPLYNLKNSAFH